jgi:hypothetical protein
MTAQDLPVLEDWYEVQGQIRGTVYNHPNFQDGGIVQSGNILSISKDRILKTEIRDYKLGVEKEVHKGF